MPFLEPTLDGIDARPELRQLLSRITFQSRLSALTAQETERHLAHRLRVAGHAGAELFPPRVARRLHSVSRGIPRLLNIVAHKSLLLAYGEGALRGGTQHVRAAALDTPSAGAAGLIALCAARLRWNE